VTARKLYNIIKSAEGGKPGENPEEYRNSIINLPVYDITRDMTWASDTMKALIASSYHA
jgi:hypothetical protein